MTTTERRDERIVRPELAELPAPLADFDRGFDPDPEEVGGGKHGMVAALANRPFRFLWLAELLTQTAQNALWYTALVLVERATQSTTLLSVTVISAILPAALLGMPAGILVDRWPKKPTLVACNLLRAAAVLAYLLHGQSLLWVFAANFAINAVAQFFYPAELASIPHFLPKRQLTVAMGLFNLTWTVAQFLGLILLGPTLLKGLGSEGGPIAIVAGSAGVYALSALLMALLPHDTADDEERAARAAQGGARGAGALRSLWHDLHEGLVCIHHNVPARLAILYLALTTTLLLVIATLAPRFAVQELRIRAEDAIFLIAPAGLAMAAASSVAHRLARRFRRELLVQRGLLLMIGALLALALVGPVQQWAVAHGLVREVDLRDAWHLILSRVGVTMGLAAIIGWQVGLVLVPAQAIVAEWAPEDLRGRIFAIQLTITNLASIFPLLLLGGLADLLGLPAVIALLALGILGLWLLTLRNADVLTLHPSGPQGPCGGS
ncbi:MAG: MFS transporter [Chloroflexota bacterium]|nr:MFS transporter [Chloroflexota bacterium]